MSRFLSRMSKLAAAARIAKADAARTGRDVSVNEVLTRVNRSVRYQLRDVMQSITERDRLQACGRRRVVDHVELRLGSRGAGYRGLKLCESIWACPTCSASIRSVRADEIQTAALKHIENDGGALFITMTLPHGREDDLRGLLNQVTKGWGVFMNRRAGKEWKQRLGIIGYIRAVEVTYGAAGWHPHLHLLVFTSGQPTALERRAFQSWLRGQWVDYAADRDWKATGGKFGVKVQDCTGSDGIAKYTAKVQDHAGIERVLGAEMARADLKRGRSRGGMTPFEMLAEIAVQRSKGAHRVGVRRLINLWQEYERETAGLSALRWSPGLRDRLGISDITDAEILAMQDLGDDAYTVMMIPGQDWLAVCRRGGRAQLLEITERYGGQAAAEFVNKCVLDEITAWATDVEEMLAAQRLRT